MLMALRAILIGMDIAEGGKRHTYWLHEFRQQLGLEDDDVGFAAISTYGREEAAKSIEDGLAALTEARHPGDGDAEGLERQHLIGFFRPGLIGNYSRLGAHRGSSLYC